MFSSSSFRVSTTTCTLRVDEAPTKERKKSRENKKIKFAYFSFFSLTFQLMTSFVFLVVLAASRREAKKVQNLIK